MAGETIDRTKAQSAARRLMVIVPDRVSDWIQKGEVIDRYLNPGEVFGHVDLVVTNDDRPDSTAIEKMVGDATFAIHNLPTSKAQFALTLGWQPELLRRWGRAATRLADRLRPDLIRCHGVRLNVFAAACIKAEQGTPYVVSIHSNPDIDQLRGRRAHGIVRRITGVLVRRVEAFGLRNADMALPVYEAIVPYLRRLGIERFRVAYNVVALNAVPKGSWDQAGERLRFVTVSRQERGEKDPSPIIEAVAGLPSAELLVVGDGPLHGELVRLASRLGARDRVSFERSLDNDELVRRLHDCDVFAYSSELWELSKACIEACLTGLPVVANNRRGEPAPELVGGHVCLVDGTARSYLREFERLRAASARETLGKAALSFAAERWDPRITERVFAEIYQSFI